MGDSDENRKLLVDLIINKFDNIEEKLEKHSNVLESINVTMSKNTQSLEEHMRRTEAVEERLDFVEADLDPLLDKSKEYKGMAKLIGWIIGAVVTIAGIWKAIKGGS